MWAFISGLSLVASLACVHSRQNEDNNASIYSRELRTDTYIVDYKGGKVTRGKRGKIDKKDKTKKSKDKYEEPTSSSAESSTMNKIPYPTLSPSIRLTTYLKVTKKKEETESLDDRNTIPKITTPTSPSMSVVSQIEQDSSDNGDIYLVDYKGGKVTRGKRGKIDKKDKTKKSKDKYEEPTSSSTESIAPNMIPFPTLSPSIRLTTYIPVGKKKEETESLDDRNTIPKITTPTSPSMSVVSQIEQDSSDNGDIFSRTTIPSAPLTSNIPTNENKTDLFFLNISNLTSIPVLTINKTLAPTIVTFAATGSPTFSPTMMIPVTKELTLQPTRSSKSPAFQPSLMPTKHDTTVSTVDTKTLNSTEEAFFITASPSEMCITGTDKSEELGNCLIGRDTTGCDDKKCESIICSDLGDGFCCDTTWDSICASQAEIYCVLDKLPNSNCYSYSDESGCDNQVCADEICQYDDHCCTENWDFDCIIQAIQLCCTSYFLR